MAIYLNTQEVLESRQDVFWAVGFDHQTDEGHIIYLDREEAATEEAACRLIREKLKVEVTSCQVVRRAPDRVIEPRSAK